MLSSFYWVLPKEIAGMALPTASCIHPFVQNPEEALRQEIEVEIGELRHAGIGAIVTLTENALFSAPFEEAGFRYLHIPVRDMTAPSQEQIDQFVRFSKESIAAQKAVVAHCLGGSGRTGTMIACYLVSKGQSAPQAMQAVRRARPYAIETMTQESAVMEYAIRICAGK